MRGNSCSIPVGTIRESNGINCSASVLVKYLDLIRGVTQMDSEIVTVLDEGNAIHRDGVRCTTDHQGVGLAHRSVRVVNDVLAAARAPEIGVAASPAGEPVIAGPAGEPVIAGAAVQSVIPGACVQHVIPRATGNPVIYVAANERVRPIRAVDIEALRQEGRVGKRRAVIELHAIERLLPEHIGRIEGIEVDHIIGIAPNLERQGAQRQFQVGCGDAGPQAQHVPVTTGGDMVGAVA